MRQQMYFNNKKVKPVINNRRDADRLISSTSKAFNLLTMTVLHNKFGFGRKRLERFLDEFHNLLECYNGDWVSVEDLNQDLYEMTGIKVI